MEILSNDYIIFRGIEKKVLEGKRLSFEDGVFLFNFKNLVEVGKLADFVRRKLHGDKTYFVVNRHINYTNICVNRCNFCAFYRKKGDEDGFSLTLSQIEEMIKRSKDMGINEVHVVGSLNPDYPYTFYVDMIRTIKRVLPHVKIQAFTPVEIDFISKIGKKGYEDTLIELKEVGLSALAGGGAEIFSLRVRKKICPDKLSPSGWKDVLRSASKVGIKVNSSILYGHIETFEERVSHLLELRELQDEIENIMAFVPFPFFPKNTNMRDFGNKRGYDDLKMLAVARLFLDNIPHIKAFWIMITPMLAQISQFFGVDDLDGTVEEEKIIHSAGAETKEGMGKEEMIKLIKKSGKIPVERDTIYNEIKIY